MSAKLTIDEVIAIVTRQRLSPPDQIALIKELKARAQTKEADKEPGEPKAKNQLVILSDPSGQRGWVIQIPESASPASLVDRVNEAAHAFNASKKGHLLPVKSISEALSGISRKWFKNVDLTLVRTKEAVAIIPLAADKLSEPPSV